MKKTGSTNDIKPFEVKLPKDLEKRLEKLELILSDSFIERLSDIQSSEVLEKRLAEVEEATKIVKQTSVNTAFVEAKIEEVLNEIFKEKFEASSKFITIQYNITNFFEEMLQDKVAEEVNKLNKTIEDLSFSINKKLGPEESILTAATLTDFQKRIQGEIEKENERVEKLQKSYLLDINACNKELKEVMRETDGKIESIKRVLEEVEKKTEIKMNERNDEDKNKRDRNMDSEFDREPNPDPDLDLSDQNEQHLNKLIYLENIVTELKVDFNRVKPMLDTLCSLTANESYFDDAVNNTKEIKERVSNLDGFSLRVEAELADLKNEYKLIESNSTVVFNTLKDIGSELNELKQETKKQKLSAEKIEKIVIARLEKLENRDEEKTIKSKTEANNSKIITEDFETQIQFLETKLSDLTNKYKTLDQKIEDNVATSLKKNNLKLNLSLKNAFEDIVTKTYNIFSGFDVVITKLNHDLSRKIININSNLVRLLKKNDIQHSSLTMQMKLKAEKVSKIEKQLSDLSSYANSLKLNDEQVKIENARSINDFTEKFINQEKYISNKFELLEKKLNQEIQKFEIKTPVEAAGIINPITINNSFNKRNSEFFLRKEDNTDTYNKLMKIITNVENKSDLNYKLVAQNSEVNTYELHKAMKELSKEFNNVKEELEEKLSEEILKSKIVLENELKLLDNKISGETRKLVDESKNTSDLLKTELKKLEGNTTALWDSFALFSQMQSNQAKKK